MDSDTNPRTEFGRLLRELRVRYDLTQEQLGEATNTSPRYISKAEYGVDRRTGKRMNVSRDVVALWGHALGRTDAERRQNERLLLEAAGFTVEKPARAAPVRAGRDDTVSPSLTREDLAMAVKDALRAEQEAEGLTPESIRVGFQRARLALPRENYERLVRVTSEVIEHTLALATSGQLGPTNYRPNDGEGRA